MMKLAAVAMVRNETDIIGAFLRHLDALFDYAVLMDHGSTDGTDRALEAACAQRPGWTMWHLEPVGYHQTTFNAFAMNHVMKTTDADAVIFMDADEFIDTPDPAALARSLARLTDADRVGMLRWRNVVPDRLDSRAIVPGEPVWRSPSGSPFGKVVVPRIFLQRHAHEVCLAIGNHGLYYTPENIVPMDAVGDMLHLPVRSHTQIRSKVVAGVFSIMAQAVRERVQGRHWFDILDRMADDAVTDEDLIGIAAQYGEFNSASRPVSRAALAASGYTLAPLSVPFGRDLAGVAEPAWIDPVRLVATILRRYQVEDVRNTELVLEGNRVRLALRSEAMAMG